MNDEDMLDFLMTSDFEEDYSPSDMKSMLKKYRYFYRILHGKMNLIKIESESEIENLKSTIENREGIIFSLEVDRATLQNEVSALKSRSLTWKERIKGKIIPEDENKRVR